MYDYQLKVKYQLYHDSESVLARIHGLDNLHYQCQHSHEVLIVLSEDIQKSLNLSQLPGKELISNFSTP